MVINKRQRRDRKKKSIRNKIFGTGQRPRLTVFKSAKNIFAQIIDDEQSITICSASTVEKGTKFKGVGKCNVTNAAEVGKSLATKAKEKKIEQIVFDRNGYKYHGRVKALADACREAGLKF